MTFSKSINRRARAACLAGAFAAMLVTACGGGGVATPAQPALFTSLGFLSGYASTEPTAISADGLVVVGTARTTAGIGQAFRWTAGAMTGLGLLPGGSFSTAEGVSADGSVVVGSANGTSGLDGGFFAIRWTAATGMATLERTPGSTLCAASGVSADGTIMSGICLSAGNEAVRWRQGTGVQGLGRFGFGSNLTSTATAISLDGTVIVGAGHPVLTGAVMWPVAGSAVVLGKLPGDASATAFDLSRNGTVVVGASVDSSQVSRAFRWTQEDGMVALDSGDARTRNSVAAAVSGDGGTIVGWASENGIDTAVIWDAAHGLRPLDAALAADRQTQIAGWKLNRATAISADGRTLAGYGTNPQGLIEGWTIKLPD